MTSRVTVDVWSSLSELFGEGPPRRRSLEVRIEEGMTLGALLWRLGQDNPRFAKRMYKPGSDEPSGRVSVVINDRLPELLDGFETGLHDGDRVVLVQAYTGGQGDAGSPAMDRPGG